MREYVVNKEILNIRSKASDESDETFVGQLLKGDKVWLDDEEIAGIIPRGGETNLWKIKSGSTNVVANDGVIDASEFWIKEYGIDELWNFSKGEGVTVIVIDSGIMECTDLISGRFTKITVLSDGDPVDYLGHGTLMTSIICGNGHYIKGVAPDVEIISIKFTNTINGFNLKDFISACQKLFEVIKKERNYVVNFSLALSNNMSKNDKSIIIEIIKNLSNDAVIFTAAAGNDAGEETIPASLNNVISCSGIRKENGSYIPYGLANYWDDILINAPCEFPADHLSSLFNNRSIGYQGTSHACAFITGLSALILSYGRSNNRRIDFPQMKKFLYNSSDVINEKDKTYRILNKNKLHDAFKNLFNP